jgi:N-6 DNA Methylase
MGRLCSNCSATTYYQDEHTLYSKCDFVMANPPFNVDLVDAKRIEGDPRLPFGLPGVNKANKVSNGNYLWISYFWSYLNERGRAGFVMSSQSSSAGHGEKDVRKMRTSSLRPWSPTSSASPAAPCSNTSVKARSMPKYWWAWLAAGFGRSQQH